MELLQILIDFFTTQTKNGAFSEILNLLKENSFDFKKTLSNLNPQTVAPIIKEFMNYSNKKSPLNNSGQSVGVQPISNIADRDIVYTLNKYLGECDLA